MMRNLLILALLFAVPASAQTVRDRNGNPLYHYSTQGDRTYVHDNAGNPHGYYQQTPGGGVEFRSNAGNLITRETR